MCEDDRIKLYAFVIMPNHIHLILTIGENESLLSDKKIREGSNYTSFLFSSFELTKNFHYYEQKYLFFWNLGFRTADFLY